VYKIQKQLEDRMMPRLFKHRTNLQAAGDVAVAGMKGFVNGAAGSFILAGTGMAFAGPIAAVASACALGAALSIIPAYHLYKEFIKPTSSSSLVNAGVDFLSKASFAFASGCLGAAILGMAVAPIGLVALSASLTFGIINLMTALIVESTAPKDDFERYSACRLC
jgi:hypothetical protein